MRLKIIAPSRIVVDTPVVRIIAEGPEGQFGILPRHIDYVSQLVPGILVYETEDGSEHYAGVSSGTLVRCGEDVFVATRSAVLDDNLDALQDRIREETKQLSETERTARSALARLEARMMRRLRELEQSV